jgi:hypothetical protein
LTLSRKAKKAVVMDVFLSVNRAHLGDGSTGGAGHRGSHRNVTGVAMYSSSWFESSRLQEKSNRLRSRGHGRARGSLAHQGARGERRGGRCRAAGQASNKGACSIIF